MRFILIMLTMYSYFEIIFFKSAWYWLNKSSKAKSLLLITSKRIDFPHHNWYGSITAKIMLTSSNLHIFFNNPIEFFIFANQFSMVLTYHWQYYNHSSGSRSARTDLQASATVHLHWLPKSESMYQLMQLLLLNLQLRLLLQMNHQSVQNANPMPILTKW